MHFIGLQVLIFHIPQCQFRIFYPKRAILLDLAIYTQNLVEQTCCFTLMAFSIDRKQRTDIIGLETKPQDGQT